MSGFVDNPVHFTPYSETVLCRRCQQHRVQTTAHSVKRLIDPRRKCMSHQRVPKLGRSGVVLIGCVLATVCVVGLLYGRGGSGTPSAPNGRGGGGALG